MGVEEAIKPEDGDQAEAPSLEESPDKAEALTKDSQSEHDQTNPTEAGPTEKSSDISKNQEEKEGDKHKQPEKETPAQGEPSKRVREGQRWNDRPRKQYGNQDDRPSKRHNNKSDLVSQKESSDPVAIRKQVGVPFRCYTASFSLTNT